VVARFYHNLTDLEILSGSMFLPNPNKNHSPKLLESDFCYFCIARRSFNAGGYIARRRLGEGGLIPRRSFNEGERARRI
jgi:hypothetical protein